MIKFFNFAYFYKAQNQLLNILNFKLNWMKIQMYDKSSLSPIKFRITNEMFRLNWQKNDKNFELNS